MDLGLEGWGVDIKDWEVQGYEDVLRGFARMAGYGCMEQKDFASASPTIWMGRHICYVGRRLLRRRHVHRLRR